MSYFKLSPETLEKWTSTRKGEQKVGSIFIHPGIYATKNFQADSMWFYLVFFIELVTLLVALFFTGFNPFIIIGAIFAILLDGIFAIKLHSGEKNINKYKCRLEKVSYEEKIKLIDNATLRLETENCNRSISAWEKKKRPFIFGLCIIGVLKVGFTFFALLPYGILAYLVPALFFIAIYIHIKHTGFWNAHRIFKKASRKEEAIFHYDVANGQRNASKYFIDASTPFPLENLPTNLKVELEKKVLAIANLSVDEKNRLRVDDKNQNDINSKDIIIAGKNSGHKLLYSETTQDFRFSFWGNIKDNDLFEMIAESGLSDDMKSFLCYTGLKAQNPSQPVMPR